MVDHVFADHAHSCFWSKRNSFDFNRSDASCESRYYVVRIKKEALAQCQSVKRNPCGSELARDSGGSVNIDVECYAVIASKLAPTGLCLN